MDIHVKLSTINQAIHDLKQSQMEILRKIHMNSGDTVNTQDNKHFEKLETILSVLEDKYGKHNSALNEVKNKVVTLLEKVGELTTDIKTIQRYAFNTKSRDVKLEKTTGQGTIYEILLK